ncbi:Hypothetical predicted protein [Podarcis lilfordi]|uniref:Uncharacterized protein n=1 Tax=Podarcis lilfordi TaxID=74358 RepID=A0AA35JVB5_9SAUR|nr:Hypothetical predicted protein [Podarcis lilfordi]
MDSRPRWLIVLQRTCHEALRRQGEDLCACEERLGLITSSCRQPPKYLQRDVTEAVASKVALGSVFPGEKATSIYESYYLWFLE